MPITSYGWRYLIFKKANISDAIICEIANTIFRYSPPLWCDYICDFHVKIIQCDYFLKILEIKFRKNWLSKTFKPSEIRNSEYQYVNWSFHDIDKIMIKSSISTYKLAFCPNELSQALLFFSFLSIYFLDESCRPKKLHRIKCTICSRNVRIGFRANCPIQVGQIRWEIS